MAATKSIILVTGPARSGKSEWAEHLASGFENQGYTVHYVATSSLDPSDQDWMARVEQHRQRRPNSWHTLDVPVALADTLLNATPTNCLLVDSLGTWLANGIEWDDSQWQQHYETLLSAIQACTCTVIFVSEETGWGVVPAYPMGRVFRDRLGILTRKIGAIAHTTYLVTGGHVLNLSQLGTPLN